MKEISRIWWTDEIILELFLGNHASTYCFSFAIFKNFGFDLQLCRQNMPFSANE
jgi:hypothetical protein